MSPFEYEEKLSQLRDGVATAREEFDAARAELLRACKIVPDIGITTPDGTDLWRKATARYKLAERAYAAALKRFAAAVHDLRLL